MVDIAMGIVVLAVRWEAEKHRSGCDMEAEVATKVLMVLRWLPT
jgi:hypothetical protein